MSPSSTPSRTDVLIIGAGPVGLTLANELARHGLRPRIIDKAPAIREVSKALILHVRTQELLDKVGIMPAVTAEAHPLTEVVVHAYGKHIGSWHLTGIQGPYHNPLILGQNRTQHHLENLLRAQNVSVEWNTEATTLSLLDDAAHATFKHTNPTTGQSTEETIRAAYVVGCDGSSSIVRKSINATFEGERYSGEQFIQADCHIRWAMPKNRSHLFLTSVGYLMVIEMPNNIVRIFISIPDSQAHAEETKAAGAVEDTSNQPTLQEISDTLTRLTGIQADLSNPTWLARYRTSHRYANIFRAGRAFIAGDAGHVHVPIGGQGMNTGIQDACNLGWKLAGVLRGVYHPSLLDTYHQERHPVAQSLIHGTDFAYKGILHPSELKQRTARLLGPFIIQSETAQSFMRNTLEELNIAYPHTTLNEDHGGSTGPKPGERALDADIVRLSDHVTTNLTTLTRTTTWTLLLFAANASADHAATLINLAQQITTNWPNSIQTYHILPSSKPDTTYPNPATVLLDPYHQLHTTYGISHPTLYLLRPDSVIAFRGHHTDAPHLLAYLTRIFT